MVKKILFLSANPIDTERLQLDKEAREIEESLALSHGRKDFEFKPILATRFKDLRRALLKFQPSIVHFSGHGARDGIYLVDEQGRKTLVEGKVLASLLSSSGGIECVVLNACYSRQQAHAIACEVPYVIGVDFTIQDDAAIEFATAFYDGLGAGKDISDAFEIAKTSAEWRQSDVTIDLVRQPQDCGQENRDTSDNSQVLRLETEREKALKLLDSMSRLSVILGHLQQKQVIEDLRERQKRLQSLVARPLKAHIALLGLTGAGKTTLLNAVAGAKIGVAGGGGAQSAAAITLERSTKPRYEVVIHYLSLEDIQDLLLEAKIQIERRDFSKLPDQQGLSQELKSLLGALGITSETLVQDREVTFKDFSTRVSEVLQQGEITKSFARGEEETLFEFIRQHTNRTGAYWPITDLIEIKGPFLGIPKGAVIWDLPGLGDLSHLRISRTQKYMEQADQVIIVINERGILDNVKIFLSNLHFISQILTYDAIPQITIVGTRLDERVLNVSTRELRMWGMEQESNGGDILQKVFDEWEERVKEQWKNILTEWSSNTLGKKVSKKTKGKVKQIVSNTEVIPTTPLTYLRLEGIESDRWGIARRLCQSRECTGVPRVRESIKKMVEQQKFLLAAQIRDETQDLFQWVKPSVNNILVQVQADIVSSEEVLAFWRTVKKCFKISRKLRLRSPQTKPLEQKIEKEIKQGWAGLDRDALYKMLEPYNKIHYQTLMAALRRQGKFRSRGKSKVFVNIPSTAGAYVAEPVALTIKGFWSEVMSFLRTQVEERINFYTSTINECMQEMRLSKSETILILVEVVDNVLRQHEKRIRKVVNSLSFEEQGLVEKIYDALGYGMMSVMKVALDERGRGARDRAITDIAVLTPKMLPSIANDAARILADDIGAQIKQTVLETQERVLAVEKSTMSSLEEKEGLSLKEEKERLKVKPLAQKLSKELQVVESLF